MGPAALKNIISQVENTSQLSAGCSDTFDELLLEDHVDDNHRQDGERSSCHHRRVF